MQAGELTALKCLGLALRDAPLCGAPQGEGHMMVAGEVSHMMVAGQARFALDLAALHAERCVD
jgi:hypothetical protein